MVSSVVWLCCQWLEEGRQNEHRLGWKSIKERYPEKSTTPERKRNQQSTFFKHIWNGTKGRFHARAIIFSFYCLVQLGVRINDKTTWNSVTRVCVCVCNFRVHCRTTGVPEGYSMLQKSRESFPITNLSTGSFFKAFLRHRSHPGETGQGPSREEVRACRSDGLSPAAVSMTAEAFNHLPEHYSFYLRSKVFHTSVMLCWKATKQKKEVFLGWKEQAKLVIESSICN